MKWKLNTTCVMVERAVSVFVLFGPYKRSSQGFIVGFPPHTLTAASLDSFGPRPLAQRHGEVLWRLALTCNANHRPLCRVQYRVLALPLPALMFGQVPRQRVSRGPRGTRRTRGQRPRRALATEGRLADAGALAQSIVVRGLHLVCGAARDVTE